MTCSCSSEYETLNKNYLEWLSYSINGSDIFSSGSHVHILMSYPFHFIRYSLHCENRIIIVNA